MNIVYAKNREALIFALAPLERDRYPRGAPRIMLAFPVGDWPPRMELLSEVDKQALAHLLSGGAETSAVFTQVD